MPETAAPTAVDRSPGEPTGAEGRPQSEGRNEADAGRDGARAPAGNLAAKRVLDVTVAAIGLTLSAPLWGLIAAAIKWEDGGPIFFTHTRVGKDREPFEAVKFRSMVDGDHEAVKGHPDGDLITTVGGFMRTCALDELPQLWNILKGDMSFVGPRPLPPEEKSRENGGQPIRLAKIPGYELRHTLRPGLTGIAQVRAPRDVAYRQKFRYDCFYVRHRSLALDVRLIARSVVVSLCGKWPEVGQSEETTYLG